MSKTTRKYSDAVENYFQTVIKKSWTWEKLTEQERQRFIDKIDFDVIRGNDKQRVEWLNSMYHAFLEGCGYEPIGWREANKNEKSNGIYDCEMLVAILQAYRRQIERSGDEYPAVVVSDIRASLDYVLSKC